jgi:uncharacterized protein YkwD
VPRLYERHQLRRRCRGAVAPRRVFLGSEDGRPSDRLKVLAGRADTSPDIMSTRGIPPIIAMVLVTLMLVAGPSTVAHASTRIANRDRLLKLINQSRVNHGLRPLRLNVSLSDYAYRHSRNICAANTLFHSTTLTTRITSTTNASYWGENIAYGFTLRQIRNMWMHSAPHRANILDRHYRRAGVGVYVGRGWLWATVDFYG